MSQQIADIQREQKPALQSERAYQALRSAILVGQYRPGEKLKIDLLQKNLELSSSPLREALNRLVSEGLVAADDRRGFRAAAVSGQDLTDLTVARIVCEPGALAAAIRRGNDIWEGNIVAAHHRLEWIEKRIAGSELTRSEDWTLRHKGFHMALISGCGSDRLLGTCSNLFDQAERYRRLSVKLRRKPRKISSEHRNLMQAALDRRVDEATDLLIQHITQTTENLLAHMSAQDGD